MSSTVTLRQWFTFAPEMPTHIIFGSEKGWQVEWEEITTGVLLQLSEVSDAALDRKFSDGFGGNDSPNFCAWSPNYVLFSDNYDGAESIQWVPRNPIVHEPTRPGGG